MHLSVVIITLNEEKYVWKLLDCLKNQTFKDFEVILVDGMSEDKTLEVVKRYDEDLDINIVVAEKRGTGHQRNLGAKNAKYEDIVFFDADNVIGDNFLEKVIIYIEKREVDCITGLYRSQEPSVYHNFFNFVQNSGILLLRKLSPVATGAFIFCKKEPFNEVGGFDETIIYAEDSDFVKRIFKKGYKFDVLKNPKVFYSGRRLNKEGQFRLAIRVIRAHLMMIFGTKFDDIKKINYKFGHYEQE